MKKKQKKHISYDTYNNESTSLVSHTRLSGISLELSSVILPFFQVMASTTIPSTKTPPFYHYFMTFSFPKFLFQVSADQCHNLQYRHSFAIGPFINKWHTIIGAGNNFYTRIDSAICSALCNIGLKLISPSVGITDFIYIVNCARTFGNLGLGVEVVGVKKRLGINFISRLEACSSVFSFGMQQFSQCVFSVYRKINEMVEFGLEIEKKESLSFSTGVRLSNYKSDVKLTLNNKRELGVAWEERLSPRLSFNFTGTFDNEGFEHGISFIYN